MTDASCGKPDWEVVFPDLAIDSVPFPHVVFNGDGPNSHRLVLSVLKEDEDNFQFAIRFNGVAAFQYWSGDAVIGQTDWEQRCVNWPLDVPVVRTVFRTGNSDFVRRVRASLADQRHEWSDEVQHYFVLLGEHFLEIAALGCELGADSSA